MLTGLLVLLLLPANAMAALAVSGTRFVHEEGTQVLVVPLRNAGSTPLLVQGWLDDGNPQEGPDAVSVPFFLTPPLQRLEPGASTRVEVRRTGEALPPDRESLFWINLLEVPSSPAIASDLLRLSYRLRMKLLYRPAALPGAAGDAASSVRWEWLAGAAPRLRLHNPSVFHVSYPKVELWSGVRVTMLGQVTVPPMSVTELPLPELDVRASMVRYEAVVDRGKRIEGTAVIVPVALDESGQKAVNPINHMGEP